MTLPLAGKVALVTGGSRGIGAAIAQRLAKDGAAVAITYSSSKEKAEAFVRSLEGAGGKGKAIQADSADAAAVVKAVDQTALWLGRLDILVNNAGIAVLAPVDQFSLESFDQMIAVNVRTVFVASQAACKYLKDGGRIITIGSTNAERMPFQGGAPYAMTKAAVAGLTRGMARDLGPKGITVNVVQPGPVDTDMNPANGPASDMLKGMLAIGRYAKGEEVAAMVSYLAGPEAGFVTGAMLMIDGGFSA